MNSSKTRNRIGLKRVCHSARRAAGRHGPVACAVHLRVDGSGMKRHQLTRLRWDGTRQKKKNRGKFRG